MDTRFTRYFYYSPNDKQVFVIIGYSAVDSTSNVDEMIGYLREDSKSFADLAGVSLNTVKTYQITRSSRFAQMRVYYAACESKPEGAHALDKDRHEHMFHFLDNT